MLTNHNLFDFWRAKLTTSLSMKNKALFLGRHLKSNPPLSSGEGWSSISAMYFSASGIGEVLSRNIFDLSQESRAKFLLCDNGFAFRIVLCIIIFIAGLVLPGIIVAMLLISVCPYFLRAARRFVLSSMVQPLFGGRCSSSSACTFLTVFRLLIVQSSRALVM